MTARAQYVQKSAWLGTEFGESYARRLFGDEVIDQTPRYVRGKNAGKFKASVEWIKVERGGWVKTGTYYGEPEGTVERRVGKQIAARLILVPFGGGEPKIFAQTGETHRFH
jgi:hypothetical protein